MLNLTMPGLKLACLLLSPRPPEEDSSDGLYVCSVEMRMKDGTTKPGVAKCLYFTDALDRQEALGEVQGLYEALNVPHMVQGLAVFQEYNPGTSDTYLWVVTE